MKPKILLLSVALISLSFLSCHRQEAKTEKSSSKKSLARKINVIVYDNFPETRANYFVTELKNVLPEVEITKTHEPLPKSAWYAPRKRYLARNILDSMKIFTPNDAISLGLTSKDISQMRGEVNWGIMGLSYMPGKTVIISTFRLNKHNTNHQGVKLCMHELGHAEGLDHCDKSKSCLMRDAKGTNHFDELTGFCESCKKHLMKKGWLL